MAQPIFHRFADLVPELRHRIWYLSLPAAAVVEIEFCAIAGHWFCPPASLPPSCGLLGACIESRNVYLKNYKPTFYATDNHLYWNAKVDHFLLVNNTTGGVTVSQRLVYLDFDIDTVYIGPSSQGELCFTEFSLKTLSQIPTMEKLKFLAVENEEWSNDLTIEDGELSTLVLLFKHLQKVSVLVGDISWMSMVHANGRRPEGKIEIVDCEGVEWLSKSIARIDKKWRISVTGFEQEAGEVHFGFDVKRILRGGETWRGNLDMLA